MSARDGNSQPRIEIDLVSSDDEESPLRKNAPPAIRWAESTVAKSDDDAGSAGDSPEAREAAMETPLGGNTSLSEGSAIIAEPASAEPGGALAGTFSDLGALVREPRQVTAV